MMPYRIQQLGKRISKQVSDWPWHVQPKHVDAMLDKLSAFGLSHIYDETLSPRYDRDAVWIDTALPQQSRSLRRDAA